MTGSAVIFAAFLATSLQLCKARKCFTGFGSVVWKLVRNESEGGVCGHCKNDNQIFTELIFVMMIDALVCELTLYF